MRRPAARRPAPSSPRIQAPGRREPDDGLGDHASPTRHRRVGRQADRRADQTPGAGDCRGEQDEKKRSEQAGHEHLHRGPKTRSKPPSINPGRIGDAQQDHTLTSPGGTVTIRGNCSKEREVPARGGDVVSAGPRWLPLRYDWCRSAHASARAASRSTIENSAKPTATSVGRAPGGRAGRDRPVLLRRVRRGARRT